MPGPWLSWTRTLSCKSDTKDVVYDPKHQRHSSRIQPALASPVVNPVPFHAKGKNPGTKSSAQPQHSSSLISRSSCNCSNLKDIVHGNTRVIHRASSSGSPQSIKDSADFLNEVSQDALFLEDHDNHHCNSASPCGDAPLLLPSSTSSSSSSSSGNHRQVLVVSRKRFGGSCNGCNVLDTMDSMVASCKDSLSVASAASMIARNCNLPHISCQKCGDCFTKIDALEHHHTIQHAVSELGRGDSSRNIIEIIFRSSWISSNSSIGRIERVLKVHNSQRTLARFEDYRDSVKLRANCMARKNARCIADGNELLRFYGSSVACPLGAHGSSSVCSLAHCSICRIIRSGFVSKNTKGICTTATSSSAHVEESFGGNAGKRAMVVCRVIAGRSYRTSCSTNGIGEISGCPNGYDSVVGGIGSDGGSLVVFNPRAVLPCFVVIYKCG
ncbi:uncharacterized protein LOC9644152 [Selaginella moellendorffii]|uniref:uncharacterized protein LOC9644152 n=1 Tax=Selaginella moellendorffii TaxID=88036 RepID=UPI000D1CBF78|nr:uncharacterized protein LOC9644152 [Selaginella moellendorffii]XP_024544659.1 uncharacterized protein LOC9644152 [Selaginella moellendorffii]|eukprot:XP_024544658.1 uncharacterized protein LOC9644152 [Selaginella moellendorffii]